MKDVLVVSLLPLPEKTPSLFEIYNPMSKEHLTLLRGSFALMSLLNIIPDEVVDFGLLIP